MSFNILDFKNNLSVIILCGGKGERLRPLTRKTPKPLIKIGSKTILEHIINHLLKYNLKNINIATGYKYKLIDAFLTKKFKYKKVIRTFYTGENTDILNRIKKIAQKSNKYLLICYGDTLADINLNSVIKNFKKKKNKIIMSTYQLETQFGIVKEKKNQIIKLFEKPKLNIWYNIGYFLIPTKEIKNYKKNNGFIKFINYKIKKKKIFNFKHQGKHITVNTISELEKAKTLIKEFV